MTGQVIAFNPLDKKNLGSSVAAALMAQPQKSLGGMRSFHGAGIYAIYCTGKFKVVDKDENRATSPFCIHP